MRRAAIYVLVAIAAAVALSVVWRRSSEPAKGSTSAGESASAALGGSAGSPHVASNPTTVVASATPAVEKGAGAITIPFGAGAEALGRGVTADGRFVAPSSFLADGDELVVLDQENARIWRSKGAPIPLPGKHADDVARAADGALAVLDRKEGKEITMLDPSGRVRGRIPIEGAGIQEARDVSRVFVSGNDVLVERNGGGPLLRVGTTDGAPAKERTEIQGVPTRDGKWLASAGITNEDEGRAWVTLADRQAVHRWTRELKFPSVLSAVAFLDSDANGTIWAVLLAGSTPADYVNWAVCLDPATGALRGSFTLAVENPPWESFRDFAVRDGAGLIAAMRTSAGVSYATYRCP